MEESTGGKCLVHMHPLSSQGTVCSLLDLGGQGTSWQHAPLEGFAGMDPEDEAITTGLLQEKRTLVLLASHRKVEAPKAP